MARWYPDNTTAGGYWEGDIPPIPPCELSAVSAPDYSATLERIAVALERIATLLELGVCFDKDTKGE